MSNLAAPGGAYANKVANSPRANPFKKHEHHQATNVDVNSLNCPDWLKDALLKLDTDGDGLEKEEIEDMISYMAKQKQAAMDSNTVELDYTRFPPKVVEVMAIWDTDGGGTVSASELAAAAAAQKKMDNENRHLKKAVYGLVIMIFILAVLNFVMGYLAAEAAKDARPADSSDDSRMVRQLSISNYFDRIIDMSGGKKSRRRLEDAAAPAAQEGAMKTSDGIVTGQAQTMDTYVGTDAIKRLQEMPSEEVGFIDTLILPSWKGEVKLGPFTSCSEFENMETGEISKTYKSAETSIKIVTPPRDPYDTVCGNPEPFMEIQYLLRNEFDFISMEDIKSDGMHRCNPFSYKACNETDADVAERNDALMYDASMYPNDCVAVATVLTVRGQPKSPESVAKTPIVDKKAFCDPTGACTMSQLNAYETAMNMNITTAVEFNNMANAAGLVTSGNAPGGTLPSFNTMLNASKMNDPSIAHTVLNMYENRLRMRRRRLEADLLSGNVERIRRRRLAGHEDAFDADEATHSAIKLREQSDHVFAEQLSAGAFVESATTMVPQMALALEGIVDAHDTDANGYLTQEEANQCISALTMTDKSMQTAPKKKKGKDTAGQKQCKYFSKVRVACANAGTDFDNKALNGADAMALCAKMDKDGDLSVSQEECKSFGTKVTPMDKMIEKCAGGDSAKEKTCIDQGVSMKDCVEVMKDVNSGEEFVAKFQCIIRDTSPPYASMGTEGGIGAAEVNTAFAKLMEEGTAVGGIEIDEHSHGLRKLKRNSGAYPRKLREMRDVKGKFPFATKSFVDRSTGKIARRHSALASRHLTSMEKQHNDPFHELVFERLLNIPRMRAMEVKIERKEAEVRQRMRRALGEHDYENWILERRLKATEKLRRRRVLLAFDGEKDDPEVAHRKLLRIGRRLTEVSMAASNVDKSTSSKRRSLTAGNAKQRLQAAGRKLVAEDDHEDRKLRHLLDKEHSTVSSLHNEWIRELKIKRTSHEMRQLMHLFHQGKKTIRRHLTSHPAGDGAHDHAPPTNEEFIGDFTTMMDYAETPAGDVGAVTQYAKDIASDPTYMNNMSPPQAAIISLMAEMNGDNMKPIMNYLDGQLKDNAAAEQAAAAGNPVQGSNPMVGVNTDGSTFRDVTNSKKARKLFSKMRILQEIGERRRLAALEIPNDDDGNSNRRNLAINEADNYHRILGAHGAGTLGNFMDSPVTDSREALAMFEGDTTKVKALAKLCDTATNDLLTGAGRRMRRMLKEISPMLQSHERRELSMGELEEDSGEGDIDVQTMACTPCMVKEFLEPESTAVLAAQPEAKHAKQDGDSQWCVESYSNYMAVILDEPPVDSSATMYLNDPTTPNCAANLTFMPGPYGCTMKQDPTTGDVKPFDINACTGHAIPGNGQDMSATNQMDPAAMMGYGNARRSLSAAVNSGFTITSDNRRRMSKSALINEKGGHFMYAHKRTQPLNYIRATKLAAVEKGRRLMGSGDQLAPKTVHFDGHGRMLDAAVLDEQICNDPTALPSQKMACDDNAFFADPLAMPDFLIEVGATGETQNRASLPEVSMVQFIEEMFHELEVCKGLPPMEKEMPKLSNGVQMDYDANNMFSVNLNADIMGPGCMGECFCHYLIKLPNNKEGIANVCDYNGHAYCPCMERKRECLAEINAQWEAKSTPANPAPKLGTDDAAMAAAATETMANIPSVRKLAKRKVLRNSRLASFEYKRLLSHDVKGLIHNAEMKQARRRSLLIDEHKFTKAQVDKIEKTEKFIHNHVGKKHKSIRVLTGKTGDARRNLEFIDVVNKNVKKFRQRRRRQRQLLAEKKKSNKQQKQLPGPSSSKMSTKSSKRALQTTDYGPTGVVTGGASTGLMPAALHDDTLPAVENYAEANTAYDPDGTTTEDPNPTTPYPDYVPDPEPMNAMPLTAAPHYDPTEYDEPIDIITHINEKFYDGTDDSYLNIVSIRVEKKPKAADMFYDPANPTQTIDPWTERVCVVLYDTANASPNPEVCYPAIRYDPHQFGYSPTLDMEFDQDVATYCPTFAPQPAYTNYDVNKFETDSSPSTMAPEWNLDGHAGVNKMFSENCIDGSPVDPETMREYEERYGSAVQYRGRVLSSRQLSRGRGMRARDDTFEDPTEGPPEPRRDERYETMRPAIRGPAQLEERLRDFAMNELGRECDERRNPDACPAGEGWSDGRAMLEQIDRAFSGDAAGSGGLNRDEMTHRGLVERVREVEMRGGPTEMAREGLLHREMEERAPSDLRETLTRLVPAGLVRPRISNTESRARDPLDTIRDTKEDQTDDRRVTVADYRKYAERCETPGSDNDPEACTTAIAVNERMRDMSDSRGSGGRGGSRDEAEAEAGRRPIGREEVRRIVEEARPGSDESMPRGGGESLGVSNFAARSLALGDSRTYEEARVKFRTMSDGTGKLDKRSMEKPKTIRDKLEKKRGKGKQTLGDKKKAREERRKNRKNRKLATRLARKAKKNRRNQKKIQNEIIDRIQSRLRRRARQLMQKNGETELKQSHIAQAYEEDFNRKIRRMEAEVKKTNCPKTKKALRVLQSSHKDTMRRLSPVTLPDMGATANYITDPFTNEKFPIDMPSMSDIPGMGSSGEEDHAMPEAFYMMADVSQENMRIMQEEANDVLGTLESAKVELQEMKNSDPKTISNPAIMSAVEESLKQTNEAIKLINNGKKIYSEKQRVIDAKKSEDLENKATLDKTSMTTLGNSNPTARIPDPMKRKENMWKTHGTTSDDPGNEAGIGTTTIEMPTGKIPDQSKCNYDANDCSSDATLALCTDFASTRHTNNPGKGYNTLVFRSAGTALAPLVFSGASPAATSTCCALKCKTIEEVDTANSWKGYRIESFDGDMTMTYAEAHDVSTCMRTITHGMPDLAPLIQQDDMMTPEEFTAIVMESKGDTDDASEGKGGDMGHMGGEGDEMSEADMAMEEFEVLTSALPEAHEPGAQIAMEDFEEATYNTEIGHYDHPPECVGTFSVTTPEGFSAANGGIISYGRSRTRKLIEKIANKHSKSNKSLNVRSRSGKHSKKRRDKIVKRLEKRLLSGHRNTGELFAVAFGKRRHRRTLLLDTPITKNMVEDHPSNKMQNFRALSNQRSSQSLKSKLLNRLLQVDVTANDAPEIRMPGTTDTGFKAMSPGTEYEVNCDDANLIALGISGAGEAAPGQVEAEIDAIFMGDSEIKGDIMQQQKQVNEEDQMTGGGADAMVDMYMEDDDMDDYDDDDMYMDYDFDYLRKERRLLKEKSKSFGRRGRLGKNKRQAKVQQLRSFYRKNGMIDENAINSKRQLLAKALGAPQKNNNNNNVPKLSGPTKKFVKRNLDLYVEPASTFAPSMGIAVSQEKVDTVSPEAMANHLAILTNMEGGNNPDNMMATVAPATTVTPPNPTTTNMPVMLNSYATNIPPAADADWATMPPDYTGPVEDMEMHYNVTSGDYEYAYTGANFSNIEAFGDPEDYIHMADAEANAIAQEDTLKMYNEEPANEFNDTAVDAFMSQMSAEDGTMTAHIPPGHDCESHGTSMFVLESYNPYDTSLAGETTQIDYADLCEHRRVQQSRAAKVEWYLEQIIERKAQSEVTAGIKTNVFRRALRASETNDPNPKNNIPSIMRKFLGIPQQWEMEKVKRRMLAKKIKNLKSKALISGRKLSDEPTGSDMAYMDTQMVEKLFPNPEGTDEAEQNLAEMTGSGMEAKGMMAYDDEVMMDPDQQMLVESFEEMPDYLMQDGAMSGPIQKEMESIYESYEDAKDRAFFKYSKNAASLQRGINIGLTMQERVELSDTVREIFTTPEPGTDPMSIWSGNDPDQCHMLYEMENGCAGLLWMSTDWSNQWNFDWSSGNDPPEPLIDNSDDTPHQKCSKMTKKFAQKWGISGKKTADRAMGKSLLKALQVQGDWGSSSDADSIWYHVQNNAGKPTDATLEALCGKIYDQGDTAGNAYTMKDDTFINDALTKSVKTLLEDQDKYPAGAGAGATAKPLFKTECKAFLMDVVELIHDDVWASSTGTASIASTQHTGTNFIRYKGDFFSIRRAVLIELDMKYKYEWMMPEEKPVAVRLAACTIRAIKENKPMKRMEEMLGKVQKGEMMPMDLVQKMMEPALEEIAMKSENFDAEGNPIVMTYEEAMEMSHNTTEECKLFCTEHLAWEDLNGMPEDMKETEPTFTAGNPNYDTELYASNGGTPQTCDPNVQCAIFNEMASPEEKKDLLDIVHTNRRVRMRRERRRRMLEKRKLRAGEEEKEMKSLSPEEARRRMLKQREADYWEERGISRVTLAASGQRESRLRRTRKNRLAIAKQRFLL